jgi:hypothetical protein
MPQQFSLIQELQLPFVHATSTKHPHLHNTIVFCLKIPVVICIQRHSHREFVHLKEGKNDGGHCIQIHWPRTYKVQGLNPLTTHILPHGRKGGFGAERRRPLKGPNWAYLKYDFLFFILKKICTTEKFNIPCFFHF